jgi:hypothetical protein
MTEQDLHKAMIAGRAAIEHYLLSAMISRTGLYPRNSQQVKALALLLRRYNELLQTNLPEEKHIGRQMLIKGLNHD